VVVKDLFPAPNRSNIAVAVDELLDVDVVVLGNPNNPTGRLFRHLEHLIKHPQLTHLCWIIDEAFIEFTEAPETHSLLQKLHEFERVVLIRALTKSWSIPGLRLGFIATSNEIWMNKLRSMQPPWPVNGITEKWAHEHLTTANQAAMIQAISRTAHIRGDLTTRIATLPHLTPEDSDANFFLLHCAEANAETLAVNLAQQGVLVRVCQGFEGLDQSQYLRLAVRTPAENDQVLQALEKAINYTPKTVPRRHSRPMRAISVLGTSSNSGKSWMATALCAWLKRRGLNVAPFKAQNMSNNSAVTLDGGEIGRAQAAQAEACGLPPSVRMNPILLKPSGKSGSQLVRLGRAEGHIKAADYYKSIETLWPTVEESLTYWENRCDVLVLEGAGSPVELNLMQRDLVNFRPIRHLDARWLLVADIERGGVFAQAAGTWALTPSEDRSRCMGLIVNKFRGDLSLFSDARRFFAPHFGAPYLGTLPFVQNLQPENEDSLSDEEPPTNSGLPIHWIRLPHASNTQDANPWRLDDGVHIKWVEDAPSLANAAVIVIPGSKNSIADLRWLKQSGIADTIRVAARNGTLVVGICGGFQMLGESISDPEGIAGDPGEESGIGVLPMETWFQQDKDVKNVEATFKEERWTAYEIHMGRSRMTTPCAPLLQIQDANGTRAEGCRLNNVWGTYVHGFFEAATVRREITSIAGIPGHLTSSISFREQRNILYNGMADLLDEHLNMEDIWRYVAD
jgi:adenosylcobyric acid synthase